MTTQNPPDPKVAPVRAAIDSTVMLILARFLMPVVVAALGYMVSEALADLKNSSRDLQRQVNKLSDAEQASSAVQAGLVAKVDGVIRQVDHLQIQVDRQGSKPN